MSDFTTHLALNAALYFATGGGDFRPWALGAVLPDLPKLADPLCAALFGKRYRAHRLVAACYLDAVHTPAAALLAGAAYAVNAPQPLHALAAVTAAILLHFLADAVQDIPGRYPLLFFPLTSLRLLPPLYNPDSRLALAVGFLSLPTVGVALVFSYGDAPVFARLYPSLTLVLLSGWLVLPALTFRRWYPPPDTDLEVLADRLPRNRPVGLADVRVVNASLGVVEKWGKQFRIETAEPLPRRGTIALRGYSDGAHIRVDGWRRQPEAVKLALTALGLAAACAAFW